MGQGAVRAGPSDDEVHDVQDDVLERRAVATAFFAELPISSPALPGSAESTQEALDRRGVVDLASIGHPDDDDRDPSVLDLVEDAILADRDPPDPLSAGPGQKFRALGPRLGRQGVDCVCDAGPGVARQSLEFASCARQDLDPERAGHDLMSGPGSASHPGAELLPRDAPGVRGIRERAAGGREVEHVVQSLEEFQIRGRNDGREVTSTSDEAHPFVAIGHSIDDLGEIVARFADADGVGHGDHHSYEWYKTYTCVGLVVKRAPNVRSMSTRTTRCDARRTSATVRHMVDVASRELRNNTRALLERVAAGEEITITVDGRAVAQLVPPGRKPRWMPRDAFVRNVLRHQADPGLTDVLREMMPDTTDDIRIE